MKLKLRFYKPHKQVYYIICTNINKRILSKMKKTIPFYLVQSLTLGLTLASLFALSGCTSHPETAKKVKQASQSEAIVEKSKDIEASPNVEIIESSAKKELSSEELSSLSNFELEIQIEYSKKESHWSQFILLNHQLWQNSRAIDQAQIEQHIWDTLSNLSHSDTQATIKTLKEHPSVSVQQWGELLSILKGPVKNLQKNLDRLVNSNSDAIYTHHFLPGVGMQQMSQFQAKQFAVLLPFEGKYKQVTQQIKAGMMKAFMASDQSATLKFYDSSNIDNLESTYQQAKQEGAEFIIGPLRKEAIDHLLTSVDENVLALNSIEYAPFVQFSYKSADEINQMIKHFKAQNYQHIGILSNDGRRDLKMAQALEKAWQQETNHSAILSVYPDQKPKLRKALGDLINEASSKERYDTLRWATGQKLAFFPRTRQDFDAIVIFDSTARMAVFKPQFAFFEMKTPIYGSSQLTPKKLQKIKANRDLKGVQFLTHPATFNPQNLLSNFEAFGWDSFQVASELNNMRLGAYLASGKTGELTIKNNIVQQNLVWAVYNKDGLIEPVVKE